MIRGIGVLQRMDLIKAIRVHWVVAVILRQLLKKLIRNQKQKCYMITFIIKYIEAYDRYKTSILIFEEKYAKPYLQTKLTNCLKLQLKKVNV